MYRLLTPFLNQWELIRGSNGRIICSLGNILMKIRDLVRIQEYIVLELS